MKWRKTNGRYTTKQTEATENRTKALVDNGSGVFHQSIHPSFLAKKTRGGQFLGREDKRPRGGAKKGEKG